MAASSGGQSDGQGGPMRTFSGENEDAQEYKRWKVWVQNKLLTLDKLPAAAKGAYIYTLLQGKALECIEHLEATDYQKEDGDKVIWTLLDQRFPQKDKTDEMGESLGKIFTLKAQEGESLKTWIARAIEVFESCERKANIKFPSEAKGWVLLHRAFLTEEQQAVVLARAQGILKKENISVALRSCYPELVLRSRKTFSAHVVEDEDEINEPDLALDEVGQEVEALIADFVPDHFDLPGDELFAEADVAEVMAVSWREKRQELNRLQKSRKFSAAKELKRSFKVEIEEMKRKTKCHKCGKVGHWSRECRSKGDGKGSKSGSTSHGSSGAASGAALVQSVPEMQSVPEFIAYVFTPKTLLQRARELVQGRSQGEGPPNLVSETSSAGEVDILLVSSPGYGVLDSGCGRTIVGASTLQAFEQLWKSRGMPALERQTEVNQFRYGNGETETTDQIVLLPVHLGGKRGVISAAVVRGKAPLLISRVALQKLKATIDFSNNVIKMFDDQRPVPLKVNEAGQYVLPLIDELKCESQLPKVEEIMLTTPDDTSCTADPSPLMPCDPKPSSLPEKVHQDSPDNCSEDKLDQGHPPSYRVWIREDWGATITPIGAYQGPLWKHIHRRVVRCADSNKKLYDEIIHHSQDRKSYLHPIPKECVHIITEFHHLDPNNPESHQLENDRTLDNHMCRQLKNQVQKCFVSDNPTQECLHVHRPLSKVLVVEVFSPPRFAVECEALGFQARSIDLITGQDLTKKQTKDELETALCQDPPDLLVLCPPCTDEGGWFHLNSSKWDRLKYLQRKAKSRAFIRYCAKLFRNQVQRGKQALFEHPTGAQTWQYPEIKTLCRKYHTIKCHMCCYGLKLPESEKFIRKSTRLLVSHEEMKCLERLCPGSKDPQHRCHDTVAGSSPSVGPISVFAGKYTTEFVQAVLRTVPSYASALNPHQEVLEVIEDGIDQTGWNEVLAVRDTLKEEKSPQEVKQVLLKLHKNLGHPHNSDLVRILKHGHASEQALQLARELQCPFCESHAKPHAALPSKPSQVVGFNNQIGIDVKHLPGWKPNQKIRALNIVDTASSFQRVIPFFESETSSLLWKLVQDHWLSWAGPPKEIMLDPKATNLGEPLVIPLEKLGVHVRPIAAEAHYQLGKVESHGGWFERVLKKVLDEHSPSTKEEWLECVIQAHVKNQMIQNHGVTPCQYIFGRNPDIPSDLLSEPQSIIATTAATHDEALAKSQAIRTSARKAVLELQDNRTLRVALLARPRTSLEYPPGSLVAYWRNQKWVQGKLIQGGQWHGTAVVIGNVGRNIVIAHRKHVLRVAPEQLRPATSEEKQLLGTPQGDLLGIKDLIEGGAFKSNQYVDLIHQSYPSIGTPPVPPGLRPTFGPHQEHISQVKESEIDSLPVPSSVPNEMETSPDDPMPSVQPSASPGETVVSPEAEVSSESSSSRSSEPYASTAPVSTPETYGPVRRKIIGKNGPEALWRPPAMRQEDFVSIMKEVVPTLIEEFTSADSSASQGSKRNLESNSETDPNQPAVTKVRVDAVCPMVPSEQNLHEVFSVAQMNDANLTIDVLIAEYLKKKMTKELHHSNNPSALQSKIDEGKQVEWNTLLNKPNVLRIHYGKAARNIKQQFSHRFIGSRFVLTRKPLEEGQTVDPDNWTTFDVKGRWCLQGHLDPDLDAKAMEGRLQSPTLNQLSRMTLMQIIASFGWDLELGDIKGAFLESGEIDAKYRPLYAHQPPGGVPGLPVDAVIEVIGNVYGQNDAPAAWHTTFDSEAQKIGWTPSKFDKCLYTLRDKGKLVGIMGVHVDDTALGGEGLVFRQAVQDLRKRFPYRKWRINSGEFCGAFYKQDVKTKKIEMSMSKFAEGLKAANIKKGTNPDTELQPFQVKQLRGINGSLNWLSSQSRPDLAAQTSLSQQAFPNPKIRHLRAANNVIRRARMFRNLPLSFEPIDPKDLTVVCHSDAAFANVGTHTQAGYVIAFTEKCLQDGQEARWCPVTWRSYKLSRAVSSTLAAESQAFATASGTTEWLMLLLHEILEGPMNMRQCRDALHHRPPILVTDCKSLYDHLISPSAPTAIEDRRTSIDVVIIRESVRAMNAHVRWVPTSHMLADALTKDNGDPTDALRGCIRQSVYQISPESVVLQQQAQEKQARLERRDRSQNSESSQDM